MNKTKTSSENQIRQRRRINTNNLILLGVAIILFTIFSIFGEGFFDYRNLSTMLKNMVVPGIIALGLTPLMISRGIDISFGSNVALSSVIMALLHANGLNIYLVLAIGIICSTFFGFFNGIIIESFKLNPLIATLGSMSIFMAFGLILTNGNKPISIISDVTLYLAFDSILNIPVPIWFLAVLIIIYFFIMTFTVTGRTIYLIGANPLGAFSCGIKVRKVRIMLYTFFGAMVGIAAIFAMSTSGTGQAMLGVGILLPTLSAILLGGIGLEGGSGNIWGTLLGVIIVKMLFNGFTRIGVEANIIEMLQGGLLIVIVSIYTLTAARRAYST